MKKLLLGLVVCFGLMSSAFASDNVNFNYPPFDVLSFKDVRTVDYVSGKLKLTYSSGVTAEYNDSNKAVFNKFVASTLKTNQFVRLGSTDRYYNAKFATKITCAGSNTFFQWFGVASEFVDDGCSMFQAIRATAQ